MRERRPPSSGERPRAARFVLGLVTAASLAGLAVGGAEARPFRGSVGWSVLLCTFSGGPAAPRGADFYRDMFLNRGTGGLADYWDAVSYGSLNLGGSAVAGWFTEPLTVADAQAKSGGPNPRRGELVDDCISAAANAGTGSYTVPAGHRVAVVTHPAIDFYGGGGRAFVHSDVDVGGLGHELGHGVGLEHSYSDTGGEYDDPWDVMSYANVFAIGTARFGNGGPGLNAYHVDRMGWMPRDRIYTVGADGLTYATLTLAALNKPHVPGNLLVRVPVNPHDPFHYLTVEYRRRDGWDGGIPRDTVLIHEVKPIGEGVYRSFLLRDAANGGAPAQHVSRDGLEILVNPPQASITADQALVTIASDIAQRCLPGWVWREAGPGDRVCVEPGVRGAAWADNAAAPSRVQPGGGAWGPNTCLAGFVWREAFPGDLVCVTPEVRAQAAADNAAADGRRNPARGVYGPNTCQSGFVWREADLRDWVCVTPDVRAQAAADNAAAPGRVQPGGGAWGPHTCQSGFVWRDAFPGDLVCVTPDIRAQAAADNAQASARLARPGA